MDHPARQGMWGIFEVFCSTLVVCTVTALVIPGQRGQAYDPGGGPGTASDRSGPRRRYGRPPHRPGFLLPSWGPPGPGRCPSA